MFGISDKELYIKRLLSVVKRSYQKSELEHPLNVKSRAEDLLICVLEGDSVYEIDGKRFHLCEGDVLYISKGSSYTRYVLDENYKTVFVYFRFDADVPPMYKLFRNIDGIELTFIKLYKKWSDRMISFKSECMSILYSITAALERSQATSYLPDTKHKQFDEIVQYISENYMKEDISVSSLAQQLDISEVHFRRCFKKLHNVSPQEYITSLRIIRAKELLQYDSASIEHIAQSLGLTDAGYFSRLFKIKTGYTPTEYREMFN